MKKYIEIGRDYLQNEYNGDLKAAVLARDGIIFDSVEKIHNALDYFVEISEKRAEKVLKRHMENNKKYCIYVEI